jgi:hypothetical protein
MSTCSVYVADANHNAVKKVIPPFSGRMHGKITKIGYGFLNLKLAHFRGGFRFGHQAA